MKKLVMPRPIPGLADLRAVSALVSPFAQVALSGGSIRDAWHNQDHNDIDIAVYGFEEALYGSVVLGLLQLEAVGYALERRYNHQQRKAPIPEAVPDRQEAEGDTFGDYVADEPEHIPQLRLLDVMRFRDHRGHIVDVQVYNTHFRTIEDVLRSHDHTINQFCALRQVDGTVGAYYLNDYYMGYCRQIREGLTTERLNYVRALCKRLTWTYCGFEARQARPHLNLPYPIFYRQL